MYHKVYDSVWDCMKVYEMNDSVFEVFGSV